VNKDRINETTAFKYDLPFTFSYDFITLNLSMGYSLTYYYQSTRMLRDANIFL
jgi:hypothetical protein